jgi:hypothetical protein
VFLLTQPWNTRPDFRDRWRRRHERGAGKQVFADIMKRNPWVLMIGVLAGIAFVSAIPTLQGQPSVPHGHYFENDHGSLIPVSYHAYERALVAQQHVLTAVPCVFYALGVAVNRRPLPPPT